MFVRVFSFVRCLRLYALCVYTQLEVDLFSSNGKVGTKTVDTGKTVSQMASSQMGTSVS